MTEIPSGLGDVVLFEIIDHVAVVTLNRPEKRNAINAAIASAVDYCVKKTEADPEIRAVILASSNELAFCAGADLSEVARTGGKGLATPDGGFAGLVNAPRRKPWIAAVRGSALGGGCELMLACDMAVVSDDVRIGLPEVKRNLLAAAGGISRLPRSLPRAIALEMIATGEPIDASTARHHGLVNRVVPSAEVASAALDLANAIAANGPLSVMASLDVARQALDLNDAELRKLTMTQSAAVTSSEDTKEGVQAFLEKRKPVWTGR
ncbi:MAG: enoyl-CoA hydratase-related protein [Sphingobium sp.]